MSKTTTTLLEDKNAALMEQLKAIKEENALLKKYLNSPKEPQPQQQRQLKKNDTTDPSYAGVADAIKPMNKIVRFYTKAATTPPSPIEVISAPVPPPKTPKYPLLRRIFSI